MKAQLDITEQRMISLMDFCVANNIQGITTRKDWCQAIGFRWLNWSAIEDGRQGFTRKQLHTAGEKFGVNLNWIFGFEPSMFRGSLPSDPLELLRIALATLEAQAPPKNPKARKSRQQEIRT